MKERKKNFNKAERELSETLAVEREREGLEASVGEGAFICLCREDKFSKAYV